MGVDPVDHGDGGGEARWWAAGSASAPRSRVRSSSSSSRRSEGAGPCARIRIRRQTLAPVGKLCELDGRAQADVGLDLREVHEDPGFAPDEAQQLLAALDPSVLHELRWDQAAAVDADRDAIGGRLEAVGEEGGLGIEGDDGDVELELPRLASGARRRSWRKTSSVSSTPARSWVGEDRDEAGSAVGRDGDGSKRAATTAQESLDRVRRPAPGRWRARTRGSPGRPRVRQRPRRPAGAPRRPRSLAEEIGSRGTRAVR